MLKILEIPAAEWANHSENAHLAVFNEHRPSRANRIDYALLVVEERTQKAIGYVQVAQVDDDVVYWQFGGVFMPHRGLLGARAYDALMKYQKTKAKKMFTYIKNTNVSMIKLHLNGGLLIFGIRNVEGDILLEMGKEF